MNAGATGKIIVCGASYDIVDGAIQAGMPMVVEGEKGDCFVLLGPEPQGFGPDGFKGCVGNSF
jgi:hypothetical protein